MKSITVFFALFAIISQSVQASAIYSYTGNNYNDIASGTLFDTSMSIEGFIVLPSVLGPNETSGTPASFSFNNGISTLDDSADLDISLSTLSLTTDASGDILSWNITLYEAWPVPAAIGDTRHIISSLNLINGVRDAGVVQQCLSVSSSNQCLSANAPERAFIYNNSGTWSVTVIPDPIPIPASVWLFGSGLLGLVAISRRKTKPNS